MTRPAGIEAEDALLRRLRTAPALALLLDYDGTIMPFARTPDLARPDAPLLELLGGLARRPATSLHVVSGRTRESLAEYLGDLPIGLHAEHGLLSRPASGTWTQLPLRETSWLHVARLLVDEAGSRTPGSYVERKVGGFSWHYRAVEPAAGTAAAEALVESLERALAGSGAEVFTGSHVVEVRPQGIHKGLVTHSVAASLPAGAAIVAMGDDVTDEDLFRSITPPDGVVVRVGPREGDADLWLADPLRARAWLGRLL